MIKVCEIFAAIQGESSYAGLPCVFIRMTGCNLRCSYCDTKYAYDEGREMLLEDILDAVKSFGISLVELTGGEPLLQSGVFKLASSLLDGGYSVMVETNGSVGIGDLDPRAIIIMDIKTPGSGMDGLTEPGNIDRLKRGDEVKFVITDRSDYNWARELIRGRRLCEKCGVLLSPVFGSLPARDLAEWIIEDRLPVRLNLQLHKYMYGPEERGV